jgi:hypothetical protein
VRFPSGHQTAFLEAHQGFIQTGHDYLLFLWRPVKSSDVYMISQIYLLDADRVYAITPMSDEQRYEKLSRQAFLKRVRQVAAKNEDSM